MDGWWDVERLDDFFSRMMSANLSEKISPSLGFLIEVAKHKVLNLQSKARAFEIGERHYDMGNDLYKAMLYKRMTYTCGYWKGIEQKPENLDAAQEAKLDLVCKKLGLQKGQRVLDIGCGWGSFAKFVAEKYGERFYRMWKYYLLFCAGSFRARKNNLWHIVLSKNGVLGGYDSVR